MSKATKRKHVTKEVLDNYLVPEGPQQIVKILAGRGNNLHCAQNEKGEQFLVSMPTKYRKNVWIKRGDFVVVEPIEEGDKVKAEIVHILLKHQIKSLKEDKKWPLAFDEKGDTKSETESSDEDDLKPNPNRAAFQVGESSDESDDSSSYEEGSEETENTSENKPDA
ncbi:putative RNA-binding protein EIF1AD-like protein [Leptotrombidium deliense]|uniref:Probable RNA-binding protein EIF1AD n=1 Tax=Leptotrombidium deliense TaxID=299467 RepID=A0A443SB09_9ACAR|nr:putative RNA-binding protein EIF1AD-like protein [Leptotrombidium deliense]